MEEMISKNTVLRLTKLYEFMKARPSSKIEMRKWGEKNPEGTCLTAGCVAGWAGVHKDFRKAGYTLKSEDTHIPFKRAKNYHVLIPHYKEFTGYIAFSKFFGITADETDYLCNPFSYRALDRKNNGSVKKSAVMKRLKRYLQKYKKLKKEQLEEVS